MQHWLSARVEEWTYLSLDVKEVGRVERFEIHVVWLCGCMSDVNEVTK
jgi:hypothetical protein